MIQTGKVVRVIITRRLVYAFDNWEATSKGQLWKVLTSHHGIRKVTCGIPISASFVSSLEDCLVKAFCCA